MTILPRIRHSSDSASSNHATKPITLSWPVSPLRNLRPPIIDLMIPRVLRFNVLSSRCPVQILRHRQPRIVINTVVGPREREYLKLVPVHIAQCQGRSDPTGPHLDEALRLLDRVQHDAEPKERLSS